MAEFPPVMLWSWDHSDDLRFIHPDSAGIAFLARTVWLSPRQAVSRPRLTPLRYPRGTALMAVVRFESPGAGLPERSSAIHEVMKTAELSGIRALQIDFDAKASEREWYAAFLHDLRAALPGSLPLTITALRSWCERDDWIRDLPVADACPMLFRMGPDAGPTPPDFDEGLCRASVGVSTDELPERVPRGRRMFFFHPGRWTPEAYDAVVAQARRWR